MPLDDSDDDAFDNIQVDLSKKKALEAEGRNKESILATQEAFDRMDKLLEQKRKEQQLKKGPFRNLASITDVAKMTKYFGLRIDNTFDDFMTAKEVLVRDWQFSCFMSGMMMVIDVFVLFELPEFTHDGSDEMALPIPHLGTPFFNQTMITMAFTFGCYAGWLGTVIGFHTVLNLIQCDTEDEYNLMNAKLGSWGLEWVFWAVSRCPGKIFMPALSMYVFDQFVIICPFLCPFMCIQMCIAQKLQERSMRAGDLINVHRRELQRVMVSDDIVATIDKEEVIVILKGAQLGEYCKTYLETVGGVFYSEKRQFLDWLKRVVQSDYNDGCLNLTSCLVASKIFDKHVQLFMKREVRDSRMKTSADDDSDVDTIDGGDEED